MVKKNFSGAPFGACYMLSFQGIKCKNFCQKKARKCKRCNLQGGKAPSEKMQKNTTTLQKMQNRPKRKRQKAKTNAFAYLVPTPDRVS